MGLRADSSRTVPIGMAETRLNTEFHVAQIFSVVRRNFTLLVLPARI